MTSRDDIDAFIFFGCTTEEFPFPEPPDPEKVKKEYGDDWYRKGWFLDHLDSKANLHDSGANLYEQGVRWYKMCSWHEHDDEKDYIGVQIAENCNCYGHATELPDLMVMVKQAELKWKQLFPDIPGKLYLISEAG